MVNLIVKLGKQPAQIGIGARYWADAPAGGPSGWGLRLNFVLLSPRMGDVLAPKGKWCE